MYTMYSKLVTHMELKHKSCNLNHNFLNIAGAFTDSTTLNQTRSLHTTCTTIDVRPVYIYNVHPL